jgi:hypothetical protein
MARHLFRFRPGQYKERAQSAVQKMKLLTNDIHNYLKLYDAGIKKELISPKNKLTRHNKTNQRKDRRSECKDRD